MDVFPWVKILQEVGPLIAVIVFFVWRDYQRELHQRTQLATLEKYQRDILESLLSQTTKALTLSSECIKWLSHVLNRLLQVYPQINTEVTTSKSTLPPRPDGLK